MSSAETAPFGAVFVSRGASCSRRGRVSAAFSVRRVFILRSRFSVLDDELGRVGLPLSASISGPGRTWPRPVGRGSCGGARGIHSRPVARELLRVGLRARPVGRVALTRYSLELADPWAVARGSRAVVRGLGPSSSGRGSRVAGLRSRSPTNVGSLPPQKTRRFTKARAFARFHTANML